MYAHRLAIRGSRLLSSLVALTALLVFSSAGAGPGQVPAMDQYLDVVREAAPGLPGYTVYRPAELKAGPGKSPVVVWSNGACATSNDSHLYFLSQVAAHGFVVIAHGAPDSHASPGGMAEEDRLARAVHLHLLRFLDEQFLMQSLELFDVDRRRRAFLRRDRCTLDRV